MAEDNNNQTKKCQWCDNEYTGKARLFCPECLQKMKEMVLEGRDRINNPSSNQPCLMCGEYEGRIMYLYNENGSQKEGIPVCDLCIDKEMAEIEKLWRIR